MVKTQWTRQGGVPGGHDVICNRHGKPFVPPVRECHSIELRHSDVVADIGAYCGTFAIYCARFPVKRVIAYEPTPATFEVLARTTLPNLECKQVVVIGSGESKKVPFFISPGIGVTNSLVLKRNAAQVLQLDAITYAMAVRGASVVKIDVEGAEYSYPVVQPGVRALIIDFHPVVGLDWICDAELMISKIEAAGFTPVVKPDWSNGWTRAGSWLRSVKTSGVCATLMEGQQCCGCGADIIAKSKALCPKCFLLWTPKSRAEFALAEISK